MTLIEMKIKEFVSILGSKEPAPGGGSASALAGSIGTSLTIMVAELTIGKKKYAEHEVVIEEVNKEISVINQSLLDCIDRDTEAFNAVSAVFSMSKNTQEEQEVRKEAMQKALQGATKAPYEIMSLASEALVLTKKLVGKSNINAISDLGVAALNLKSALQGAWLNVLINLSGIKDEEFVTHYRQEGTKLLDQSTKLADEIYDEILTLI